MDRYINSNHRVNGRVIEKVASAYDALATSNRPQPIQLEVSTLSNEENSDLRQLINKTASEIEGQIAPSMDKEAFLSGGVDLFSKAKGFIMAQLKVPEEVADRLASPVVVKTQEIRTVYGGEENAIMEGLVNQMQGHIAENPELLSNGLDHTQQNMGVTQTKGLEDTIKSRLITEAQVAVPDAERVKKTIVSEARDLTTVLRPHKMNEIAHAIVDLVVEQGNVSVSYNIKDTSIYLNHLRDILQTKPNATAVNLPKGSNLTFDENEIKGRMQVPMTKYLEEQFKNRLISEVGVSTFDAERIKKMVIQDARDLTTVLRGKSMSEIGHTIIDLITERKDISLAYNVKDNPEVVAELKNRLCC